MHDITLDEAKVTYLITGALPTSPTIHSRIMKAAVKLYCNPCRVLWAKDKEAYPTQRILPIGERCALIEEAIMNVAYLSREQLCQYLKERFLW